MAKLDASGFNRDTAACIYSYLKNRKQCARRTKSYLADIISGVPQGSVLVSILYNLFFNDFFYFILLATAHNFANDNIPACFGKTINELIGSLERGWEIALNWINENKMNVNPGKFQAIITDKRSQNHTNEILKIGLKEIKAVSHVKLLAVKITYNTLNFDLFLTKIKNLYKSPEIHFW